MSQHTQTVKKKKIRETESFLMTTICQSIPEAIAYSIPAHTTLLPIAPPLLALYL
jgi:hypothetical protein